MPRDPAVISGDAVNLGVATLTAADLLVAIADKLPPFWPDNIETWFIRTEFVFCLKGVSSSQTKFDNCVQSISQEVAIKILDLFRSPPAKDPYCHLKDRRLLQMYTM